MNAQRIRWLTGRGLGVGVVAALLLSGLAPIGCSSGDKTSGSGGSGGMTGATGGRSGSGGVGGQNGGTGGAPAQDAGLPDGFNVPDGFSLDGLDIDAIAADLGITSCAVGVTEGAVCRPGTDLACRPTSGATVCLCQNSGTWSCF